MSLGEKIFIGFFATALVGALIFLGIAIGYDIGQIDALNGNAKYEYRVFKDGTSEWVKIRE